MRRDNMYVTATDTRMPVPRHAPVMHKREGAVVFRASIPASPIMRPLLAFLVLLSTNLLPLCIAEGHQPGFPVEYTLITANSPDCEPSMVDKFPVRVQYRTIIGDDGGQSNTSVSEWMDSRSPNMPGILRIVASSIQLSYVEYPCIFHLMCAYLILYK